MTYATQQDLIDRFGERELIELTDRGTPQTDAIVTSVVDAALADADEIINSYVATRYELPFATAPTALTRAATDLARYYLYDNRPTEAAKHGYDEAIRFLKDISAGRAKFDVAGSEPDQDAAGEFVGPDRVFSRTKMAGF